MPRTHENRRDQLRRSSARSRGNVPNSHRLRYAEVTLLPTAMSRTLRSRSPTIPPTEMRRPVRPDLEIPTFSAALSAGLAASRNDTTPGLFRTPNLKGLKFTKRKHTEGNTEDGRSGLASPSSRANIPREPTVHPLPPKPQSSMRRPSMVPPRPSQMGHAQENGPIPARHSGTPVAAAKNSCSVSTKFEQLESCFPWFSDFGRACSTDSIKDRKYLPPAASPLYADFWFAPRDLETPSQFRPPPNPFD